MNDQSGKPPGGPSTSEAALEKEVRTLRKQLERAERFRRRTEELKYQNDLMLQKALGELREAHSALERAKSDVETKNASLEEALISVQRTQDQLIHAEKMASLGLMVAGIAHEIKNPLNFVNNFAELAIEFIDEFRARGAAGPVDPPAVAATLDDVAQNLARIREHGQRADNIINTMLLHARERRGEPIELDINSMLVEYANIAYHGFRAADRTFVAEIVTRMDPAIGTIFGPYHELARVVVNLVSNACHAMRQRQRTGEPSYRAVLTVVSCLHPEHLEITVADNGTGIAPDVARRLFDPFFTTKPPGEGTGLGLSLSYEIVAKELGGSIQVISTPGEGAAFTICVPMRHPVLRAR